MDLIVSVNFQQIVPIRFKIKWYIFSMSITACIHGNTYSWFDLTFVNFNIKKVQEDNVFERQDILQFLSQCSKYYKCKIPNHDIRTLKLKCEFSLIMIIYNENICNWNNQLLEIKIICNTNLIIVQKFVKILKITKRICRL